MPSPIVNQYLLILSWTQHLFWEPSVKMMSWCLGTWVWGGFLGLPELFRKTSSRCLNYLYKPCGLWGKLGFPGGVWGLGMCSAEAAYVTSPQEILGHGVSEECLWLEHFTHVVTMHCWEKFGASVRFTEQGALRPVFPLLSVPGIISH